MNPIQYNEEKHEYMLDGSVVPSVTQLAKQFSGLDTTWLEAHPEFAERGTQIHNELAEYFMGGEEPTSEEARSIAAQLERSEKQECEVLVYNQTLQYAGTVDMVVREGKKIIAIIDFKSSDNKSTRNRNYYACQLNLYRLALEDMGADVSNAHMLIINPYNRHDIPVMSWDDMVSMAEKDPLDDELAALEEELISLEGAHARYEEIKAELAEKLKQKYDGKTGSATGCYYDFVCTSISQRKTFDQAKAKKLIGDDEAFESCFRMSTVSPSVRFKLKNAQ
jgi:hypothetical protein